MAYTGLRHSPCWTPSLSWCFVSRRTIWMDPRPATSPTWYQFKACFYIFNFAIDWTVVMLFLVIRHDKRMWVPDGSSKVRHYRVGAVEVVEDGEKGENMSTVSEQKGLEKAGH
ncbi:hypothetical protein PENDEC_c004G05561 [Penicillium decumbens]|uniref:Uncharacterized protein n=1 Tax=Penicillium decumbens TaxID=69771 RepID=A0A1V6PH94_PENDC|nr:hypothetical protein PENDEC_c004G05561 [Penicillium decumbens]